MYSHHTFHGIWMILLVRPIARQAMLKTVCCRSLRRLSVTSYDYTSLGLKLIPLIRTDK
jgi:hypothetical protein